MLKVLDNEVAQEEQAEGPTLDELAREGARLPRKRQNNCPSAGPTKYLVRTLQTQPACGRDERREDR